MPDQIGSVRDVVNVSGPSVVYSQDFTPYGNTVFAVGSTAPVFGFAGLVADPNSGLSYSASRFYDPTSGRWIHRDPIAESGGIDLYAYAGGNPVGRADESGLCSVPIAMGVLGGLLKLDYQLIKDAYNGTGLSTTGTYINAFVSGFGDGEALLYGRAWRAAIGFGGLFSAGGDIAQQVIDNKSGQSYNVEQTFETAFSGAAGVGVAKLLPGFGDAYASVAKGNITNYVNGNWSSMQLSTIAKTFGSKAVQENFIPAYMAGDAVQSAVKGQLGTQQ
jgi:RHS repeat-associated protein